MCHPKRLNDASLTLLTFQSRHGTSQQHGRRSSIIEEASMASMSSQGSVAGTLQTPALGHPTSGPLVASSAVQLQLPLTSRNTTPSWVRS